jgi:hypothetical protein
VTPHEVESWASRVEEQTFAGFGFSQAARRDLTSAEMNRLLQEWEVLDLDDKAMAEIIRARYLGPTGEGE